MAKHLVLEKKSGWARVSLNRPHVRNAFHPELIAEIKSTFSQLSSESGIRYVLLEGEGESFCAGADLEWMRSMAEYTYDENKKDSQDLDDMFQLLKDFPKILVTYGHGHIMGGGIGLLAVSDFVLLAPQTKLCFSEVRLGLAPAVISPYVLDRGYGPRLKQLMVLGQMFESEQALAVGLADRVVTAEEKNLFLEALDRDLKSTGPLAVGTTKGLLAQVQSTPDKSEIKRLTTETIAQIRVSSEGQEGLKAFLEKRSPSWRLP